jgi:hypothetical protein
MASLVMMALQWTGGKAGCKALGCLSLSLGSHKRARGLENSFLVGIDLLLLFQQMYIVCKDTHTPMIWGFWWIR